MDWVTLLANRLSDSDCPVCRPGDPDFETTTNLFNNAVKSPAQAVVRVSSSADVAAIILFAREHNLTISVKGGGYNTAGWAVNGNIVIDLCRLNHVAIHLPNETTGKVDVAPFGECVSPSRKNGNGITMMASRKRDENAAFGNEEEGERKLGSAEVRIKLDGGAKKPCGNGGHSSTTMGDEDILSRAMDARAAEEPTPLSFATLPLPPRPRTHLSLEPQLSQPSSVTSASTTGHPLPSTTSTTPPEPVPSPSRVDGKGNGNGNGNGKGKGRALPENDSAAEAERTTHEGEGTSALSRVLAREVAPTEAEIRSWMFDQTGGGEGLGRPVGITSDGFDFNPAASFESASSNGVTAFRRTPVIPSRLIPSRPIPLGSSSSSPSTSTSPSPSIPLLPSLSLLLPSAVQPPYALVTLGTGANSNQIDLITSSESYHVPLSAYPVGCSIFASGGFGLLSRLHGLSMDNVVEVEMVMPSGKIVRLVDREMEAGGGGGGGERERTDEEREREDLWWAFRGAGVTIGIVTRLRVKAFRIPLVYSGNLIYPFNPITTVSLIKHWRDCCKNAPRELYMNLILTAGPDASSHVVVIQICYLGPRSVGDMFLQAIMSWEGERCLLKDVDTRTFLAQQGSVAKVLSGETGVRWCIRADLVSALPDECIAKTVASFTNIPERSAWLFETAGGAIADPSPTSSCFPASHRSAVFQVAALHQWKDPTQDDLWKNTARRWIDEIISPHSPGGSFPCFLETREGVAKIRRTFGADNWKRLVGIKEKLDPENVLCNTFWPET